MILILTNEIGYFKDTLKIVHMELIYGNMSEGKSAQRFSLPVFKSYCSSGKG